MPTAHRHGFRVAHATKTILLPTLLCSGLAKVSAAAIIAPTPVAVQAAATPAGGTYGNFFIPNPVLNGDGQVAFYATGGPTGGTIFSGAPGSLQAVAFFNTNAPAGGKYGGLGSPALNSSGQVAFQSGLFAGTSTSGIFTGTVGSVQTVALQGTAAPAGGNFSTLNKPTLNDAGQMAFLGTMTGGSSTNGVFTGTAGSLQAVALQGAAAPAGGNYNTLFDPVQNQSGVLAFQSSLTGGSASGGIFTGTPGQVQAVAVAGTAAPSGGNFGNMASNGGYKPTINNSGKVAFYSPLTGGSSTGGLFAGTPGSVQTVALVGSAAPSGGKYLIFSYSPVINDAGQVAFEAPLTGGSANAGIFVGTPGSLQTLALQNDAAPGGGTYSSLGVPVINGLGQVAFTTEFNGSDALYAGVPGNVQLIVRAGDVIDVDPGPGVDNRTVDRLSFSTASGSSYGWGTDFNDAGLLVYRLRFTDNTSGIFTSTFEVPEPSSAMLLAVAGAALLKRRRRSL